MKFVILGFDGAEGTEKRPSVRPAHLRVMERLDAQGRVILAGPLSDHAGRLAGSLIIIEAASLEEAREIARTDPYTVEGVFERVHVHPFQQVFPKGDAGPTGHITN